MNKLTLIKIAVLLTIVFATIMCNAELIIKENSFKESVGFININNEKLTDENDEPYSVLKIKTININNKERRELKFSGDAQTFVETEYKDGEVWLYISHYATYLKISHEDFSSVEFYFPFDMEGKKGYDLVLINDYSNSTELPPHILEQLKRLDELENILSNEEMQHTYRKIEFENIIKNILFEYEIPVKNSIRRYKDGNNLVYSIYIKNKTKRKKIENILNQKIEAYKAKYNKNDIKVFSKNINQSVYIVLEPAKENDGNVNWSNIWNSQQNETASQVVLNNEDFKKKDKKHRNYEDIVTIASACTVGVEILIFLLLLI